MRNFITSILLLAGLSVGAQNQIPGKIHFGLVFPLSTNGVHAPLDTNNLSINLIGGVSAAERGTAFAGLSNVVLNDVKGIMFAGFSNHVKRTVDGALFAGFVNTYGGGTGSAFAGFANVATGDVKGAQFAGFINIARKVTGVQVAGFMNIADSSDYPIGIINIIKQGEKSIGVSIDENQTTMLSFRSGGKILYGIIGAGYNFKNDDAVYAFEAGLGAHFFTSNHFRLNTELVASSLTDFKNGDYFKSSLRLMPALKLTSFLEIFAGPSLNFITTSTLEGEKLTKKYLKEWPGKRDDDFRGLYLGYTGGIHVIF